MAGEVFDASDPKQVHAQEKKNQNARTQELEDIKTILNSAAGIRFFRRMLEDGRIFTTTFTGNSQTFFLEGHRNFVLKYLNDVVEVCPQRIVQLMLKED